MTKREFLMFVSNFEGMPADVTEYALNAIAQLDATNAKRRENPKPSKDALAAEDRRVAVLTWLKANESESGFDAATIAEGAGMAVTQVPAALKQAVSAGLVEKSTVKVDSKHRKTVYKYIGE